MVQHVAGESLTLVLNNIKEFDDISSNRTAPLALRGPSWLEHRIQLQPNMASPERALEETVIELTDISYRDSEYVLGDSLVFDTQIVTHDDALAAEDYKEYQKIIKRIRRNASVGRYIRDVESSQIELGTQTTTVLKALEGIDP